MPSTTKKETSVKTKPTEVKSTGTKTTAGQKKQGAVNIKTTSAHDKAKNFDEGRRNDANSNEL